MSIVRTIVLGIVVSLAASAGSITDLYLGGTSNWSDSTAWSTGLPDVGYTVSIGSGDVTLDTNATIGSLVLGGQLESSAGAQSLNVSGALTINSTGSLTFYAGSAITAGSVTNSGSLISSATLTVANTLVNQAGAFLQVNANASANAINNTGEILIATGANLNITGGGRGLTDVVAGSTWTVSGGFNVINAGSATSALANLASVEGTLDLNNNIANTVGSFNNSGALTLYSGTSLTTADLTNSGTLNAYGPLTVAGTLTNSGSLMVNSNTIVTALANSGSIVIHPYATLNITGGGAGVTDVAAGSSLNVSGNFNVINGGVSSNALGNLASVEGTLEVVNGTALNLTSLNNSGNLTLVNTNLSTRGDFTNSGMFATSGTLTVAGALNNQAGGFLQVDDAATAATLNNQGRLLIASGASLAIAGGTAVTDIGAGQTYDVLGNFTINGTSALSRLSSIEGSLTLGNGQTATLSSLNNAGNLTVLAGSTLGVSGNLTASGTTSNYGNLNVSGTYTNQGALNVSGTTNVGTLANSSAVNIAGGGNLHMTGQTGITSIGAGQSYNVDGTFTGSTNANALNTLTQNAGNLEVNNGQAIHLTTTLRNTGVITLTNAPLSTSADIYNSGTFVVGDMTAAGTLHNQAGGSFQINGTASVSALDNQGTLQIAKGATLNIDGGTGITDIAAGQTYIVSGAFNVVNGGIATSALANLSTNEGTLLLDNGFDTFTNLNNSGTLIVNSGTAVTVTGDLTNSGTMNINGSVTAANLINTGVITIHSGDGLTLGTGDDPSGFTLLEDATLTEMLFSDTSYSMMNVDGSVSLFGALDIQFADGFMPTVGDTFDILNFTPGGLTGNFSNVTSSMNFLVTYDNADGKIFLTAANPDGTTTPETPEPGTIVLFSSALVALAYWKKWFVH